MDKNACVHPKLVEIHVLYFYDACFQIVKMLKLFTMYEEDPNVKLLIVKVLFLLLTILNTGFREHP